MERVDRFGAVRWAGGVGGLSQEVAFQQRPEIRRELCGYRREELSGVGEQLMQRP